MKLKTWWKHAVFHYDILKVDDTCVDYLKMVTFWHPEYKEYQTTVSHVSNIE